jgi:hypothetical protein
MLRTFENGSIEYFIDQDRHIVFCRWEGDVRGDELLATSPELWRRHPEIGRWSAIHDQLDYTGILEHRYTRELMQLRASVIPDFDPQARTAIVTADLAKTFELKVAKANAPNRLFQLFPSSAAALDWVIADEPGNPCAGLRDAGNALPWWFERKPAGSVARVR